MITLFPSQRGFKATASSVYLAGVVASAPPYTFTKASHATKAPKATSLITPNGTVTNAPGAVVGTPSGTVTSVTGSTTFAGQTDAFLLKVLP